MVREVSNVFLIVMGFNDLAVLLIHAWKFYYFLGCIKKCDYTKLLLQ